MLPSPILDFLRYTSGLWRDWFSNDQNLPPLPSGLALCPELFTGHSDFIGVLRPTACAEHHTLGIVPVSSRRQPLSKALGERAGGGSAGEVLAVRA